jgi:late competence protein required for DNA uptake (superfamily II DNA/RNA helicase)
MNTQHSMEERLWEYIDGTAAPAERQVIEELLQTQSDWKEKYGELMELNTLLHSTELEAPSLRFTKNVMEEITRSHIAPATKTYINNKIIWGIGIFFLGIIVAILTYGFSQMEWSTSANSTLTDQLEKIDVSKFFNKTLLNVFMMINVVLGLVLLDFYLGNKRKQFRKEA